MTQSREVRIILVGSRLGIEADEARELRALLQGPVDWAALLALAIPHGVLPLIFLSLRTVASDLVPASLLSQLGTHAERIRVRNERALAELASILESLRHAGIEGIPFKGPVLQQTIYRGLPVREFFDLDLLVPREQAIAAAEVMQANGYRLSKRQEHGGLRALLRNGDEAEFQRDGRMSVDLHWRFSNLAFDFPLDPGTLHSELESVEISGCLARTYRPDVALLILCAHQANHRWRRLNWLCDLDALLENRGDAIHWPAVLKTARVLRSERILLTTLRLTESLLGARLPRSVDDRLRVDRRASKLADSLAPAILKGHGRRRWLYVQMREGNRLGVCGRYLASKVRWYCA